MARNTVAERYSIWSEREIEKESKGEREKEKDRVEWK